MLFVVSQFALCASPKSISHLYMDISGASPPPRGDSGSDSDDSVSGLTRSKGLARLLASEVHATHEIVLPPCQRPHPRETGAVVLGMRHGCIVKPLITVDSSVSYEDPFESDRASPALPVPTTLKTGLSVTSPILKPVAAGSPIELPRLPSAGRKSSMSCSSGEALPSLVNPGSGSFRDLARATNLRHSPITPRVQRPMSGLLRPVDAFPPVESQHTSSYVVNRPGRRLKPQQSVADDDF